MMKSEDEVKTALELAIENWETEFDIGIQVVISTLEWVLS